MMQTLHCSSTSLSISLVVGSIRADSIHLNLEKRCGGIRQEMRMIRANYSRAHFFRSLFGTLFLGYLSSIVYINTIDILYIAYLMV